GRYCYTARLAHVTGDRLAQFRQPGRRSVVSESLVQRVGSRLDDVARGIEIRLTNFEVNNVASLCLQRSRFHQDLEGSLSPEARHALGEAKFASLGHDGEMSIKAR